MGGYVQTGRCLNQTSPWVLRDLGCRKDSGRQTGPDYWCNMNQVQHKIWREKYQHHVPKVNPENRRKTQGQMTVSRSRRCKGRLLVDTKYSRSLCFGTTTHTIAKRACARKTGLVGNTLGTGWIMRGSGFWSLGKKRVSRESPLRLISIGEWKWSDFYDWFRSEQGHRTQKWWTRETGYHQPMIFDLCRLRYITWLLQVKNMYVGPDCLIRQSKVKLWLRQLTEVVKVIDCDSPIQQMSVITDRSLPGCSNLYA